MVTVEVVSNSTRVMGVRVPVCIVLDGTMLLFLVVSFISVEILFLFHGRKFGLLCF